MRFNYTYQGKHRAPTPSSQLPKKAATLAVGVPLVFATTNGAAYGDPDMGWQPIIECESGGDPNAHNPTSSASGLFQFLDSTWASVGGTGEARDASVSEQYMRANMLFERAGLSPWNASRDCWGRHASGSPAPRHAVSEPARHAVSTQGDASAAAADQPYVCTTDLLYYEECDPADLGQTVDDPGGGSASVAVSTTATANLGVRGPNGLGSYICDESKLYFDACDPHNLGEVAEYPLYD